MDDNTSLSIRLSAEELVMLLWLLNTPTLPGLGDNPFAGWTEREIAIALASAERSLRARRFISKTSEGQIQMEQVVMALVGTCAAPEVSVVLSCETPERGRFVHYFHATSLLAVEHTNPEPGIHLFEALEGKQAILKRLEALLALSGQSAPPARPGQITLATLQEATRAAQEGAEKAQIVLESQGLDAQTAGALGETLARVRRRSALAVIHGLREKNPRSDGLVILEGPNGLWALQAEGEQPQSPAHIWPQTAVQIRQRLQELLEGQPIQFAS